MPEASALYGRRANNVRRLCPTTWLVAADGGRLVEVAREGTTVVADGNDPNIDFLDIDGDLDDFAVVLGKSNGRAPLLCTRIGKRWLLPYEVTDATHISGLCRVDDERWLVTGRSRDGQAWAGLYRPLALELTPLPTPVCRALLACASRRNRRLAVAVGSGGAVLSLDGQSSGTNVAPGQPDLSIVSLDVAGQLWTGSIGRLYFGTTPLAPLRCVWTDPSWQVPFVCMHVEVGHVLALTVDGGVVEGQSLQFSNHG